MSLTLLFWLLARRWAGEPTATVPTPPTTTTPPAPAGQKRVRWTEIQPKVRVRPEYPDEARLAGIEGECRIRMCVDESGKVTDAYPVSCPQVFVDSAVTASKKSTFYPLKGSGAPIPACFDLRYRYKLTDEEPKAARPDLDPPDPEPPDPATPGPSPTEPPIDGGPDPLEPAPRTP